MGRAHDRYRRPAGALLSAALAAGQPFAAAGTQTVEVIAAARRSPQFDPAAPTTVLLGEALARAGIASAEEALRRIAANQSDQGLAQNVGEFGGALAEADLRGVGADKTLVLLNGHRVANHAYDGAAVDLSTIPISAIDRIEVRRSGASGLYGSGASSGVIDFILRRDITGVELAAEIERPGRPGADADQAGFGAGFGRLETDGFNLYGSIDLRRQQALRARDRPFAASLVRGGPGGNADLSDLGASAFPGDLDGFEPSFDAGCAPPTSIPDRATGSCRYDFVRDIDLIPASRRRTLLGVATLALGGERRLSIEALQSRIETRSTQTPTAARSVIPDTSPYWIAGRPTTPFVGFGRGGVADWLVAPAGPRINDTRSTANRLLATLEGQTSGIAWEVMLARSTSRVSDTLAGGFLDGERLQRDVAAGMIDPFGPPSATGAAALRGAELRGRLLDARGEVHSVQTRGTTDLAALAGGPLQAAAGVELRDERFAFDTAPLAARLRDAGLDPASGARGARRGVAVTAALHLPLDTRFEATLALRHDRSASHSVTSPTLGLRWQPASGLSLRASFDSGFRAPTLYEIHQPYRLVPSSENFDDPLLCPDGVAEPGIAADRVCRRPVLVRSGGPVAQGQPPGRLRPERSRSSTWGFSYGSADASASWSFGADAWFMHLRDEVDVLGADAVFDDPERHAARIVRCSRLDPAVRATISACRDAIGFDPIAFVDTPTENRGGIRTRGIDLSLRYDAISGPVAGGWSFSFEGTWVQRHDLRSDPGAAWLPSAGRTAGDVPVFRWQHTAQLDEHAGAWSASVSQRYRSGYRDQHPAHRVGAYAPIDLSLSYTGLADTVISAGIRNLFDTDPPFSGQQETLQRNYDPRFTDPTGRTFYVRAAWRWR